VADIRVSAEVRADGSVELRRRDTNHSLGSGHVEFKGLEADLIRVFERWLSQRARTWEEDELRAFGGLLHRVLFPPASWAAFVAIADEAARTNERVSLELVFPFDPPYSRLAAIPWEYLYAPDTAARGGFFLATRPSIVLTRFVPPTDVGPGPIEQPLRVLAVPSAPDDLGEVVWEPAVEAIEKAGEEAGFAVDVLEDPNTQELGDRLADPSRRVDLVHFIGHGTFDPKTGSASLSLTSSEGLQEPVSDRGFAQLVTRSRPFPRAVVLQACDAGRTDYQASFAGIAPQLVREGVGCAVAMQYPVTNRVANAFTAALYAALSRGADIDRAVQEARFAIVVPGALSDPRLVGLPVTYLSRRRALAVGGGGP
jgi:hypothetical protein